METKRLNLNIDAKEYEKLKQLAKKAGMSLAAFVRVAIKDIISNKKIKLDLE